MASIELGKIPGLKTLDGHSLDLSAGGVSAVMNDLAKYYPRFLADQGSLVIIGVLMDQISTEKMTFMRTLNVPIEDHTWQVGVYEYRASNGARYLFLDNPSFKRFTATPNKKKLGQSIYTLRGLEDGSTESQLEEQRVWSAINQSIAQVFAQEKAQIYVPHDYHVSPASFYISKRMREAPIASKPLVHNEGYLGSYFASGEQWEKVRRVWSLSGDEMNHYFLQGTQLAMMAPAVRLAEETEVFSALSVSTGTAHSINGSDGRKKTPTQIDFFDRVGDLTNGFSEENRPYLSPHLKGGATVASVQADGIHDPEAIHRFQGTGFAFGFQGQSEGEIHQTKRDAKVALQRNFGMTVDPRKPLFVSFARMVHQKGLEFVASNVEHILNQGGQVIVGGPVGDAVGARERSLFWRLKKSSFILVILRLVISFLSMEQ